MSRNISFAMTAPQLLDGSKTVTRRHGWRFLRAGEVLNAVEKGMGLKRGEKVKVLARIRITDIRREPLNQVCADLKYGYDEMVREGFPPGHQYFDPTEFILFFCDSHKGCKPDSQITRIEFEKL